MLIEKDGSRKENINMVLLTKDREVVLNDNQFFQITPTGKRLELWKGNPDDENAETCDRLAYWNVDSSVIAYYELKGVE